MPITIPFTVPTQKILDKERQRANKLAENLKLAAAWELDRGTTADAAVSLQKAADAEAAVELYDAALAGDLDKLLLTIANTIEEGQGAFHAAFILRKLVNNRPA